MEIVPPRKNISDFDLRNEKLPVQSAYKRDQIKSLHGEMPPCVIVHVEDIRSIRFATEHVAKQTKYIYHGFSNGEDALAFIQKYEVDVVLMDIDLAGGGGSWDGYETARRILDLYPEQLIYSASAEKEIDNPLVGQRPMFNGHLGRGNRELYKK